MLSIGGYPKELCAMVVDSVKGSYARCPSLVHISNFAKDMKVTIPPLNVVLDIMRRESLWNSADVTELPSVENGLVNGAALHVRLLVGLGGREREEHDGCVNSSYECGCLSNIDILECNAPEISSAGNLVNAFELRSEERRV